MHYSVADGKVHLGTDRFHESELPTRLRGLRYSGVQSVSVFVLKKKPKPMAQWQKLDITQKELDATQVVKLEPHDSVETWVARVHEAIDRYQPELAELSITAVRA